MKYFIYVLLILAFGLLIFNLFQLDFDHLFGEQSSVALIGVLASLCVIVIMLILLTTRAIKKKSEEQGR